MNEPTNRCLNWIKKYTEHAVRDIDNFNFGACKDSLEGLIDEVAILETLLEKDNEE